MCITEVIRVRAVPLGEVDDAHAHAEGEGYADAGAWRAGHERFWLSPGMVSARGEPALELDDTTSVVCVDMRVVQRFRRP